MVTEALLEAYKATCYEILSPKIEIFIDKENTTLQTFLKENQFTSWCFITAWNPYSKLISKSENEKLNIRLEKDLHEFTFFLAQGRDTLSDWAPESSFFVGNIPKEHATFLGKKYQQNAIVYGEINALASLVVLID